MKSKRLFMLSKNTIKSLTPPLLWNRLRLLNPKATPSEDELKKIEIHRIYNLPPITPTTTWLISKDFKIPDPPSFVSTYGSYFNKQYFKFKCTKPSPYIIDGGANIGVSVHYWKKLYPNSRIIAFEPDPSLFSILEQNCKTLGNIALKNEALWIENTKLDFSPNGADGGHLSDLSATRNSIITAKCIPLKDYLCEPVDLLKLDIEGAEGAVIADCADSLHQIHFIFVEYHSFVNNAQHLGQLLNTLEQAGFRLHITINKSAEQPFINLPVSNQKDMRLNIYAINQNFPVAAPQCP